MSVLRHSPEEYVRRAAVAGSAYSFAVRLGFPALAEESKARALYNLAMSFEALAWRKLTERFNRNDARLS